jgi:hypothetical protein
MITRRGFARNFKFKPPEAARNPFEIPLEVKERVNAFVERRLKKSVHQNEKGQFVKFDEFTGKTHEFEVFLRDEQMFNKSEQQIHITDPDLAQTKT